MNSPPTILGVVGFCDSLTIRRFYSWSDLIKSGTNLLCNSLLVWCSSENSDITNNYVLNNLNCFKFVKGTCWCYRLFSLYLNNPCFVVILMGYLMAYKLYIWDAFNKYILEVWSITVCSIKLENCIWNIFGNHLIPWSMQLSWM